MRPSIINQIRYDSGSTSIRENPSFSPEDARYAFDVHTGSRWLELAEREPDPMPLFGPFWRQGELCLLFADTNVGKSILAVQIANSIARRCAIPPFTAQAPRSSVLYVDFELSAKQFSARCSDETGQYPFPDRFFRAGIRPDNDIPAGAAHDAYIIAALEYRVRQLWASVLIIDNISCLRGGTENTAVALRLIKSLRELQQRYQLSILVLAHTPKRRNAARPISAEDLQGSKMLINLADSAFTIGRSSLDASLRYLKQIKQRTGELIHGDDNVCLCHIIRKNKLLRFRFTGTCSEAPHLHRSPLNLTRHAKTAKKQTARNRFRRQVQYLAAQKLSQRQISTRLGISLGMVNKLVKEGEPV